MSVVVITPPADWVSLALAKSHLRVDHADDDALIAAYIAAAQSTFDGPEGSLGIAVGLQTLEYRMDSFWSQDWRMRGGWAWSGGWDWARWPFERIQLPLPPFVAVTQIVYEDLTGADQVLTPTGWAATDEGVTPDFGDVWPSGRVAANAVRIQYQAGYAPVPAPLIAATLLTIGSLYTNRVPELLADRAASADAAQLGNLLAPYRRVRC